MLPVFLIPVLHDSETFQISISNMAHEYKESFMQSLLCKCKGDLYIE